MEVIRGDRRAASQQRTDERNERVGRALLASAVCAFVGVAVPLVIRGAPLADDFNNCVGAGWSWDSAASWRWS
jgi:hypothetical protein